MREDLDLVKRRAWWVYETARLEAIASRRLIVPEPFGVRESVFQQQFYDVIRRNCAPDYDTTPAHEHDLWVKAYREMGWCYGPARDPVVKAHPDMVLFAELPLAEQEKDAVFLELCDLARRFIRDPTL